ncbi:ninein isoform X2 [Coregonus clupeaformis]|uniref:ninein isoform X2 n=1 Tax=Coregonus clupeaformis TaxID=59861 RepID=UPI001E1C5C19|nr:ninein isoform X2 [Coregonus clupeaformis]
MDDGQQDQYEERLKEVFESFDASGAGSLCPEELSDLCQALHLEDSTPTLLHALLQNQDRLTGRVDFDQFKNALILVLSTNVAATPAHSQETTSTLLPPDSPVQAKFVRGSKRYGRHSTPEFTETIADFSDATGQDPEDHEDSSVPRKRERWNALERGTEEYEAEGQLHLWNPDEPSTPRGSITPLSDRLEERFREACEELAMSWDGCASHHELLALCDHLGLEVTEDVLQVLSVNEIMSVQAFASWVLNHAKPPTPSASTPYRQLKRLHSSQPFDETGRRTSAMTSTIGMRLFSTLDDGTGSTPAEDVLDAWTEEGIENSSEILQALDFDLEGKVNLGELTVALENELLMTKNGIHRAALASFKAEIRYLLERVDRELREKVKIRSDLEKAEKLKTQLATEVDEHHSAIERMNDLNLRKLEQEHREKLVSVRSELIREMDQIQQQAGLQREELEAEMEKIRDDETFLRDHLSLTVKESRRLEMELLDSTEKLVEAENQVSKLQRNLDNILKEKFGDLDPGSAEFFLQEERLRRLRSSYEEQCRALQDRIDELQAELQEYHNLGRTSQPCLKPSLSEDLESKSPGVESDPGLGSEEGQPLFNMSLEAEMMLERLKEKHLREMEDLQAQLESKVSEFDQKVEEQKADLEAQKAALSLQYLEEIQALRGEMSGIQNRALELQAQVENAEEERACLEQRQAGVLEELEHQQEQEVSSLRQELLEAHIQASALEEQLKVLEAQQAEAELGVDTEMRELRKLHALELNKLDEQHDKILQVRLEEERGKLREERAEVERRLSEEWEREKVELQRSHEEAVKARIEEVSLKFQAEREESEMRLTEEWEREKVALQRSHEEAVKARIEESEMRLTEEWEREKVALQRSHEEVVKARIEEVERRLSEEWEREKVQLDEQSNASLQTMLEDEMLRLVEEQEGRESRLAEQWELERVQLQECQEEALLTRLAEEKLKQQEETERRLREDWDRERLQLEKDYEGMLQERLQEHRERLAGEKEELEKRLKQMMEEEKECLEEAHRQAVQELSAKHSEEREQLSGLLDKLREDIAEERKELESHFSQKIREVEARFSGDQDAVAERFQTDVSNLETHYQSELKALTESHAEQKTKWDKETEEALQEAEEQRRVLQETMEQERETITQDLVKERELLESVHKEEMDALVAKNQELQKELESLISLAQTKEIELSRQLNDLHNRLQENLDTKDELLAQSENKAREMELLLNQAVEDFKQERAELQGSLSELEARHSMAEKHLEERCELLSERDDLKLKIKELEKLLRQVAVDFQFERLELQENVSDLELKLKESRPSSDLQDNEKGELLAERDQLSIRIQEIENELNQLLESADITENKEMDESNEVNLPLLGEEHLEAAALEEQEVCSENLTVSDETCDDVVPEDCEGLDVAPVEQGPNDEVEIITESPHEMESSENIIAEVCDQEIPVTSDNLNVLVEASDTSGEQGQDDEVEMIPETPNRLQECPEDTITLHLDGACYDETTVGDGQDPVVESVAVGEQAQDGDASEGGMTPESSEDIEVCPENIISVEACNGEVAAIPEECQELVEESPEFQGQAVDNMDEDTNDDMVVLSIPEEQPQSDNVDGDVCLSEMKCEVSSPDKMEQNDAGVEETGFDDKPEEEELQNHLFNEEVQGYVSLVVSSALEEIGHDTEKEAVELIPQLQQKCEEAVKERDACEITELREQVGQFQSEASRLARLQSQYDTATEENLALQQKISELQQKTDALESLSAENGGNTASDQQSLEENGTLSAQAKEIKVMSSDMAALQIRYEECICENAKLEEQNCRLEKRVLGLESKMHIIQDFQDQQVALVDEITRMREENCKLTDLVSELERQDEILMALQLEAESEEDATTEQEQESFLDLNSQLEAKIQAVSELEDCCTEFEKQNAKLRSALTDLQDKSLRIHERMQTHRNEAGRLAEENLILRHKISMLKEEDLRETQEETLLKLEHFRKEKIAAQKKAESFKRQISELRLRSQQLEDENGLLSEKNTQNAAGVEGLSQQLRDLLRQSERQEAVRDQQHTVPEDDRNKMAVCVSALEAELTNAVEGTALLEDGKAQLVLQINTRRDDKVPKMGAMECQLSHLLQDNKALEKQTQGLRNQLAKSQERTHVLEESLQSANLQSARLKSDLRVSQQEKDALKQEVMSLHKQLQNANDKNQVLEMALHSSGYQSQHKKLYRDELARLVEQEQQLLRQENERLTMELHNTKGDLHHTRDKTCQLEAAILTVKQQRQQCQSTVVKTVEQEKTAMKRELDVTHQELVSAHNKVCEVQRELESLRQENEGLKTQQNHLQARLLEALQVQLGGLLPPTPRRMPGERREQHRGDDLNPENVQDERATMMMMMKMEERMREIELSLHNVKLLLKEKVCQLKDQLHKNGKADSLIKDLYVENAQLLKALEMTEQRQKVAEKKNFLLEEKVSSLNRIVRDLSPSPLAPVPYHFTCS